MNASSKAIGPGRTTGNRVLAKAVPPAYMLALFHAEPATTQGLPLLLKKLSPRVNHKAKKTGCANLGGRTQWPKNYQRFLRIRLRTGRRRSYRSLRRSTEALVVQGHCGVFER